MCVDLADTAHEFTEAWRLFRQPDATQRTVVFYAEQGAYFKYFEGLLGPLLDKLPGRVCYISSDKHDGILRRPPPGLNVFYLSRLLPFVMPLLDARVIVMTMTDLHRYHLRRSIRGSCHVYVFHAMVSTHMMYRQGAFDHYDVVFCTGAFQQEELRKAEARTSLKPKKLLAVGYPLLDRLVEEHKANQRSSSERNEQQVILVAPSWGASNIFDSCLECLIEVILKAGMRLILRPHPEWIKRNEKKARVYQEKFGGQNDIRWDADLVSSASLHEADVLVTDWSGIALEFAFATERPVLFINVPRKVANPVYEQMGLEPLEVNVRSQIGQTIEPSQIGEAAERVRQLIAQREAYGQIIRRIRSQAVFNLGHAAEVGVAELLRLCEK